MDCHHAAGRWSDAEAAPGIIPVGLFLAPHCQGLQVKLAPTRGKKAKRQNVSPAPAKRQSELEKAPHVVTRVALAGEIHAIAMSFGSPTS